MICVSQEAQSPHVASSSHMAEGEPMYKLRGPLGDPLYPVKPPDSLLKNHYFIIYSPRNSLNNLTGPLSKEMVQYGATGCVPKIV